MFCDEISFLEEQLLLTRMTLTPDTILPTRNISTRAAAQCLHLPSRTFFFLKSHMTMFIPSGKFTSSGSSQECKQDFLDGGCSGWMGSTTILYHRLGCLCDSIPPWHRELPEGAPSRAPSRHHGRTSVGPQSNSYPWRTALLARAETVLCRFSQDWTESAKPWE